MRDMKDKKPQPYIYPGPNVYELFECNKYKQDFESLKHS